MNFLVHFQFEKDLTPFIRHTLPLLKTKFIEFF